MTRLVVEHHEALALAVLAPLFVPILFVPILFARNFARVAGH